MPSPICVVKDGAGAYGSSTDGVDVGAGDTIVIKLNDASGVTSWGISCVDSDDALVLATINAGLVIDQSLKTCTFTAPAAGSALIFNSVIQGGVKDGLTYAPYSARLEIHVLTAASLRVFATNETTEASGSFGWIKKLNAKIRQAAGSGGFTAGGDLGGTSSSQTVLNITGAAGAVNVFAANMQWDAAAGAPTLFQNPQATVGSTMTMQAANVVTGTGSNLVSKSGTGSIAAGNYVIQTGATVQCTFAPTLTTIVQPLVLGTSTVATAGTIRLNNTAQINFDRGGSNILGLWMDTGTSIAVGNANATKVTVNSGGGVSLLPAAGSAMVLSSIIQGTGAASDEFRFKVATQAMVDANQTLSNANNASFVIQTTGALTAARTLTLPATLGQVRCIDNQCTGGFGLVISPATGSLTTGLASGRLAWIYCDGTNWRRITPDQVP